MLLRILVEVFNLCEHILASAEVDVSTSVAAELDISSIQASGEDVIMVEQVAEVESEAPFDFDPFNAEVDVVMGEPMEPGELFGN